MSNRIANVQHDSTPVYRRGVRAYFNAPPIPPTRARHRAFIVGDYVARTDGIPGVTRINETHARSLTNMPGAYVLVSSALTDTDNGW